MSSEKKRGFGVFKVLAVIVVLLIVAVAALPFLIDANKYRPRLESEITGALGREVKIGNISLSLLKGGLSADDISIADDPAFSQSPFVKANSLQIGVELKPLIFSRAVHVTRVSLERPEITLVRSAAGDWNFSGIGGKGREHPKASERSVEPASDRSGPEVTVSLLKISNGRISVIRRGARANPRVYDNVNIEVRDLSFTSVMPFTMSAGLPGGGSAQLDGKAGPINSADVSLTPISAALKIKGLDLIASGFVEPDSGLTGIVDFDGSLNSDGRQIQSRGRADAGKLRIIKTGSPASKPISLEYAAAYDIRKQSGNLSDAKVEFGKAVAHLSGSYDMHGESTILKARLRGENMPAQDLEALLPAIGMTLPRGASLEGGTLNADLTADGPIERLVTSGTVDIAKAKLTGFDLGSKMTAVASLAGIKPSSVTEIEKFASELRLEPEGIQANNLVLIVPSLGQLTGSGTVGANNSLDFKMTAKLNTGTGVVGSLTRLAGVKTGSDVGVPFFVRGTTSDPKFIPDTKGIAGGLLDSALSGKDAKAGETGKGQSLGDTLRGLLKKKKP